MWTPRQRSSRRARYDARGRDARPPTRRRMGRHSRNAAEPILPEEVVDAATTSSREAIVEPATPRASRHGVAACRRRTPSSSRSASRGQTNTRWRAASARASPSSPRRWPAGYETHLIFVGDPTEPGSEVRERQAPPEALGPVDQPDISQRRLRRRRAEAQRLHRNRAHHVYEQIAAPAIGRARW